MKNRTISSALVASSVFTGVTATCLSAAAQEPIAPTGAPVTTTVTTTETTRTSAPTAAFTPLPDTVDVESKPNPRSLSLGLYTGLRPDMAQLGSTITKDGTIELSQNSVLRAFGGTKYLVMGDKDDEVLLFDSKGTNSAWQFLSDHKNGGPLTGLTLGFEVKYDFNEREHLPLFVKVSADYTFRIMGGGQSRTLGSAIETATPYGPAIREATGGVTGGVLNTSFNAWWIEVPVNVGFSIPVKNHRIYAGIGVSYFNGGFSVNIDADQKYVAALTTLTDGTNFYGPLVPTAVNQTVSFDYANVGPNFLIGAEVAVGRSALFLEFSGAGVAQTVFSNELSPTGQNALTALNSSVIGGVPSPYTQDPQYFKRLAFPVVLGGSYFRIGYRFYVL